MRLQRERLLHGTQPMLTRDSFFVWGLSLEKKNWCPAFKGCLDKFLRVIVSSAGRWRFSPSPYYKRPNILARSWCQNPFPSVPGKAAAIAISSLSPSWIYPNRSSRLLLKCFSPFRPCVPCVTLSAKGCNQLPFSVDTGKGNEEKLLIWCLRSRVWGGWMNIPQ